MARSRTIALMAAEMWTAPDAESAPVGPFEQPARSQGAEVSGDSLGRNRLMLGAGLLALHRNIHTGNIRSEGTLPALVLRMSVPLFRGLGTFCNSTRAGTRTSADSNLLAILFDGREQNSVSTF
ncbi:MAG: hypothetical protein GY811_02910 [Myxococcales bacterium]|nr:hypothetical protein [Myxococcales bacterium]